jgi:hypothetical protein
LLIEALELLSAGGEGSSGKEVLSKIEEVLSESDKYSKTGKRRRETDDRTMLGRFQSLHGAPFTCFTCFTCCTGTRVRELTQNL